MFESSESVRDSAVLLMFSRAQRRTAFKISCTLAFMLNALARNLPLTPYIGSVCHSTAWQSF